MRRGSLLMSTLVLTEYFLPTHGGSINWLVQTYSRYAPSDVIVVAPQCPGDREVDFTLPFRVERVVMSMTDWDPTAPASLWRYFRLLQHVYRSSRSYGVKQVHCAKVLPDGLVAWGLRKLTGSPYLIYAHGEEILIGLSSRKLRWLIPKIYNGAAAIIVNSRHTRALLAELGVRSNKLHLIHPGVDATAFRVDANAALIVRQQHNLGQAPVLLTVGRLQQRKGQDMVIKALPLIRQVFPEVKYLVVGAGEEHAALQQLAHEVDMQEHVVFAGRVHDSALPAYYAACDVFIMPNRRLANDIEGFGMVFLEASAAGKPVIGGRSGGTDDAIVDGVTGLRVDGDNLDMIAAAVIDLLSDPAFARSMGEQGRRRVAAEFNWDRVALRTRQLAAALN